MWIQILLLIDFKLSRPLLLFESLKHPRLSLWLGRLCLLPYWLCIFVFLDHCDLLLALLRLDDLNSQIIHHSDKVLIHLHLLHCHLGTCFRVDPTEVLPEVNYSLSLELELHQVQITIPVRLL